MPPRPRFASRDLQAFTKIESRGGRRHNIRSNVSVSRLKRRLSCRLWCLNIAKNWRLQLANSDVTVVVMKATSTRIAVLQKMLGLEEKRARLQQELDQVLGNMASLKDSIFNNAAPQPVNRDGRKPVRKTSRSSASGRTPSGSRTPRGELRDRILAALQEAGREGILVKELAGTLDTKAVNIHSWFHSNLKRYPGIKKLKGGHYVGEGSLETSQSKREPRATAKSRSPGARKGRTKRGELSTRILAELKSAGPDGIAVKDLASKLGAEYRNVYVWFATTGKRNSAVKKLGPATYKLAA